MNSIAIVGGGISGLSAAYYLAKAGVPSTLIEKRPRLGGVIQTERIDGCLVEGGPDSFLSAKPWALELIGELGLAGDVIGSNDHLRKTFIRRGGRMLAMPDGLQLLVPTRIAPIATTPLLGWGTKARMALEWFRRPPATPRGDCSVAQFVREHYGQEAVEYLAEPLLAGVYGGIPEELSVASVLPRFVELEAKYGSLTRGILAERRALRKLGNPDVPAPPLFRTLKNGLGSLIDALQRVAGDKVTVIHGEVEALEPCGEGYRLRVAGGWMCAGRVALACEAHASARLAASIDPALGEQLAGIPYHSATVVALAFAASSLRKPLEGFGFLVPRRERRLIAACTFTGTKFAFRVPEGKVLLRCFVNERKNLNEASLLQNVLEEVKEIVGLTGAPLFSRIYRWPLSMAQYVVGREQRLQEIEGRLRQHPNLHLTGNAYSGIGIPDCIRNSRRLSEGIVN